MEHHGTKQVYANDYYCFQLKLERQEATLNGSRLEQARFGSAISNVGDLNQDSYNGMLFLFYFLS